PAVGSPSVSPHGAMPRPVVRPRCGPAGVAGWDAFPSLWRPGPMNPTRRPLLLLTLALLTAPATAPAGPRPESYWNVDELQPGMRGYGRTVMRGTKVETFTAEVLGVLKNTSPGRDMVLCRLAGLNLEKTGVIAGMSGSP